LSLRNINNILTSHFTGEILQTPPAFSAKKINGKRAYELARAGKSVKLAKKKVIIYNIGVNSFKYPDLSLTIDCSSGTYIRSIAHDLGQLMSAGAYCYSLIRTKIGEYKLSKSIHLPDEEIKYHLNKKHA
jgi:tRNA pseudouridine55 synthase